MKDAQGKDIKPGLYRNVGAVVTDFDPAYSNFYVVRQLSSGLLVAKDGFGGYHRVRSRQEVAGMYDEGKVPPRGILRAIDLYQCSEQDVLCLQEKLTRAQERTPKLLSLLTYSQDHFRQSLEAASRTVAGWPDWKKGALGSLSQPKCTPIVSSGGDSGFEGAGRF